MCFCGHKSYLCPTVVGMRLATRSRDGRSILRLSELTFPYCWSVVHSDAEGTSERRRQADTDDELK